MKKVDNCPVCGKQPVLVKVTTELWYNDKRRTFKTVSLHYGCTNCCLVEGRKYTYINDYDFSPESIKKNIRSARYHMARRVAENYWEMKVNEIKSKLNSQYAE